MPAAASSHCDGRANSGTPSRKYTSAGTPITTTAATVNRRVLEDERLNVGHRSEAVPAF